MEKVLKIILLLKNLQKKNMIMEIGMKNLYQKMRKEGIKPMKNG